jgi:integrase
MTVEELFQEWLFQVKLRVKPSTLETYKLKVYKHIIPEFRKVRFNNISLTMINNFIEKKLKSGLSKRYVADIVAVLKSMARYTAKVYGCLNPIEYAPLPKFEPFKPKLLNTEEQRTLQKELLKENTTTSLGVLLCMFTGIRIGELCSLKWSNIDLTNETISITNTLQRIKTNSEHSLTKLFMGTPKSKTSIRTIPIPKFLVKLLSKFKSNDENFFISNSTKPTEPRTIQYRFKSILKRLHLPLINFHQLRHIFATNCVALGFDIKTLSEILGHSNVEITLNRYVHSSLERKSSYMNKLCLL